MMYGTKKKSSRKKKGTSAKLGYGNMSSKVVLGGETNSYKAWLKHGNSILHKKSIGY